MNREAKWITSSENMGNACVEFFYTMPLTEQIKSARVWISAMGLYDLWINGRRVGKDLFTPGWTSYRYRVQYQEYDIGAMLEENNELCIRCAQGWMNGSIARHNRDLDYAKETAVIADVEITYENGRVEHLVTDENWQVRTSQILFSDIYHGETWDKTAEPRHLGNAVLAQHDKPALIPQEGESVREQERVAAVLYIETPKGERVIDFGQNMTGYVEIRVRGKRGDRIVLTHAEVLDQEGNFYTENLRAARNCVTYVLSGDGEEILKPSFAFQGFRYIRLDEYPCETITLSNFCGVAVYSHMRRTGDFSCGHAKLNQLYSNIVWGQRSNFLDVPTDCPQRDERLGWTGDAQVFCRTAAINYDVERFFTKWLGDMRADQWENGGIPDVIPQAGLSSYKNATAWSDAAVICPWEIYRAYGNKKILQDNFEMMKKWVNYMHGFGEEEYLFVGGNHYGDWLAMDTVYGEVRGATQTDLIASAFFAYSTSLLIKAGEVLGEDMSEYRTLYENVRKAFGATFMKDGMPVIYPKADGLTEDRPVLALTQTAIVLILHFGLCEESEREALAEKLVQMIRDNDGRMTTGFVGTPYLLHALSENGKADAAFDLLLQEKNPSWLFSVNQGATTVWEHWDSIREDGTFWKKSMNSFNHYAFGSVFDWIFGVMLGVDVCEDGAGYEKITVTPHPDRRIGFAKGSVDTARGKISVYWRYVDNVRVRYEISIPEGVTATLRIVGLDEKTVTGGNYVYQV